MYRPNYKENVKTVLNDLMESKVEMVIYENTNRLFTPQGERGF